MPRPAPVIGMVEAGSPAARAGLRPAIAIVAVDGAPVRVVGRGRGRDPGAPGRAPAAHRRPRRRAPRPSISTVDDALRLRRVRLGAAHGLGRHRPLAVARRAGHPRRGLARAPGRPALGRRGDGGGRRRSRGLGGIRRRLRGGRRDGRASPSRFDAAAARTRRRSQLAAAGASARSRRSASCPRACSSRRTAWSRARRRPQGGLQPGDLILSVDGEPVGSFASFAEPVRTGGGAPLQLVFARDGEVHEATVTPELIPTDIGLGIEEPRYRIGIRGADALVVGAARPRPRAQSAGLDSPRRRDDREHDAHLPARVRQDRHRRGVDARASPAPSASRRSRATPSSAAGRPISRSWC